VLLCSQSTIFNILVLAYFASMYNVHYACVIYAHPLFSPSNIRNQGTLLRFGSLLGGSVDGADELKAVGLDECVYKMSLENYRDLKERSFDRFRIGAQILAGDAVNPKPPNQEKMEKEAIKNGEHLEAFRAVGGYPEIDRTNRHIVAQAVVQALMRPANSLPKEFSVLSKCESNLPTGEEWKNMFDSPGAASWPDPFSFDPSKYGFEVEEAK